MINMKLINSYCDPRIDKKLFNKRLKQIKLMKIKYKIVCLLGLNRMKYLKKNEIFAFLGENVLYQPTTLPNSPKLIKIHDNVKIASGVIFFEHDVINNIFRKMDNENYIGHLSCIEIHENCFIGGHSIIVGNVKIGPNAIIGAGSVVTKDVPEGAIVAGNPAVVVGSFDKLHQKRKELESNRGDIKLLDRYKELWNDFYKKRK